METVYEKFPIGWLKLDSSNGKLIGVNYADTPGESDAWNKVLKKVRDELHEYFKGEREAFTVDIDFEYYGTEFQQSVWKNLYEIPFGTTISYKTLAEQTGGANYSRAVANANGKNPVSIIVPCHRVIQSDGTLGGYTGGLDKKKYLLQLENVILI